MYNTGSTLKEVTARASVWSVISNSLEQVLRLLGVIFLARLLFPEDFGVVAMAEAFMIFVSWVLDLGLYEAIVQRKRISKRHLSTTFWVGCALGVVLCLIMVAAAPLATYFFHNELVRPVLIVTAISLAIWPIGAVHGSLLRKRLEFSRFAVAEVGGAVTYLVVSLSLAFAGFGPWSIVLGMLASNISGVALRWLLCRWHPSFIFGIREFKQLIGFGLNITGIRLVLLLGNRLDYLVIGRFLSAGALGLYNMGQRAVEYPSSIASTAAGRVAFSAFSTVQDDDERLRRGLLKSITFLSLTALPLFTGMAILAPELVTVVLGEKWQPAILPLQILCVMGAARSIGATLWHLFSSKGRPSIALKLAIFRTVLLIAFMLVGIRFGMLGVAVAVSSEAVITFVVSYICVSRFVGLKSRDHTYWSGAAALGSGVMALILVAFRQVAISSGLIPDSVLLISSVLLGVAVYFLTLKTIRSQALDEMTGLFVEVIKPYIRLVKDRTRPNHQDSIPLNTRERPEWEK